jgi:phage gp16-like protein
VRGVEGHVLQAEARRGAHAHAQRRGQRARPQATAQQSKVDNVSLCSLSTSGSHQWTSAHATIAVADAQKAKQSETHRSWPPPENSGSILTRGLRRMYSAPCPFGPYI